MSFTKPGYRPRLADDQFNLYLEAFGAVCVEGPKSCGKTWFSLNHAASVFMLADPSKNYQNMKLAEADINEAFKGDSPHLIDEWQDLIGIWDATKVKVDESAENGLFILTGSSTPPVGRLRHMGTGRIGRMRLRTMSLYESGDSTGEVTVRSLFDGSLETTEAKDVSLDTLIYLVVRGGWPRSIGMSLEAATLYNRGHVDTIIEDAASLDGKRRDTSKLRMFVRSLARNESTLAKMTTIASDTVEEKNDGSADFNEELSLSDKTIKEYMDVFERLFLIENQTAYDPNLKSEYRVGKLPKRHLTDPSLSVAALRLTAAQLKSNLDVFGNYFEALCERDLSIYARMLDGELYHYRDYRNKEIDAVMELSDGRWGAFEIKLGAKEIDSAAENMLDIVRVWESNGLKRKPEFLCVICGLCNAAYRRPDGVYVVPITALRN